MGATSARPTSTTALGALAGGGAGGAPWVVVAGATDHYPARVGPAAARGRPRRHGHRRACAAIERVDGGWRIGALTTWTDLAEADLPPLFDGLRAAALAIGGLQIQARGDRRRQRLQRLAGRRRRPEPARARRGGGAVVRRRARVSVPIGEFVTGNRRTVRAARRARDRRSSSRRRCPATRVRSTFEKLGLAGLPRDLDRDGRGRRRDRRRRPDRAGARRGRCLLGGRAAARRRSRRTLRAGRPRPRRPRSSARRTRRRSARSTTSAAPRRTGVTRRSCSFAAPSSACWHDRPAPSTAVEVDFSLNGAATSVRVDPMRRLSDVLRDDLGLTGTKVGCEAGDCGACTVRIDGRQAVSCLVPAGQVGGAEIQTVEGLAAPRGRRRRATSSERSSSTAPPSAASARPGCSWRPRPSSPRTPMPTTRRSGTASAACSADARAT